MEPFSIAVPDQVLDDLRSRLLDARWPDQIAGIGWDQGTELGWLRRLTSFWANEFDWRAWERRLNAHEHFIADGIHVMRRRAAAGNGIPLILTHGWPGSFLDYLDMLPLLPGFDVVIPSLPGYGFSRRPPEIGVNYRWTAARWHRLMGELGYSRYAVGGGDFGAGVSTFMAIDRPQAVIGLHLTTPELTPEVDEAELSEAERAYLAVRRGWDSKERGYSAIQSTKPQTVGYGLNDSPLGLAAYLGEKWHSWSDATPSDDHLCATLTLYWVTGSITSSMRDYWDNRRFPCPLSYVGTPTAFACFANSKVPEGEPPREHLVRLYNISRWTVFPRGGHFAPAEQPEAVAADLTAFFSGLAHRP